MHYYIAYNLFWNNPIFVERIFTCKTKFIAPLLYKLVA